MKVKIALVMALAIMLFTPILKLKADEVDYYEFLTNEQDEADNQWKPIEASTASVTVGYKATSPLNTYHNYTHLDCIVLDYFHAVNNLTQKKRIVNLAISIGLDYCLPPDYSLNIFKTYALIGIDINAYTSKSIRVSPFVLFGGSYYSILINDYSYFQDKMNYMDSGTLNIATGVRLRFKHKIAVVFRFDMEYDILTLLPIYSGSVTAGVWF